MGSIEIIGGKQLEGEVRIQGSKNSLVPILAATLMIEGEVCLKNCPRISDAYDVLELMAETGCSYRWENDILYIDASNLNKSSLHSEKAKTNRVSVLMLGALAGRMGCAGVVAPGGCSIGKRPVDKHIEVLNSLGIRTKEKEDYISCVVEKHVGNYIRLNIKSVGVTENAVIAATLAKGTTVIANAAREPEVDTLCDFLNKAGAKIVRIEPGIIMVEGVKRLFGIEYTLPSDRIVAGTYLTAIAAAGGVGTIKNIEYRHMEKVLEVLENTGCRIFKFKNEISVFAGKKKRSIDIITTGPYPGFPTDMQSQIIALLATAQGESVISEKVFESRFMVVPELIKMGADISICNDSAHIRGVERLNGAVVKAKELRGGAALVIAGLVAEGKTVILNTGYIKRGYVDIAKDLRGLGADIKEAL